MLRKKQELLIQYIFFLTAMVVCFTIAAIVVFVGKQGLKTFLAVSPLEFFGSTKWAPDQNQFGALTFISSSFFVTLLALLLGGPLGIAGAMFSAKIVPSWLTGYLRTVVDLLAGIPSVVYGWVGLTIIVPAIRQISPNQNGFGLLAAGIILAIMILPTVLSLAEDALRSVPRSLEEASYALGATRWQTIWHVLLPAAAPGIITGLVLGMARAIGETMAVQMVIGNTPLFPRSLFQPTATLTSEIVMEMGNTAFNSTGNNALFLMAFVLLLIALGLILLVRKFTASKEEGH
ncbi:phosphate ABC transporter permease subunit PstC [Carboxydothermus ferrireducens]|uniref:Phosphate transport system permease protein n=1 Tax=Carboxydothermus ferrireducens DSM 11255 TaxID=1119529 RepID=A0ABX2R660_9THEO|nr:phosphate ABC transporter permease subunit PstC [Carboxydothermus ferrireducens]NYE56659.1 phosphate transport system permease protein [Carboxydothermus ferrireducens DSM 11255]